MRRIGRVTVVDGKRENTRREEKGKGEKDDMGEGSAELSVEWNGVIW